MAKSFGFKQDDLDKKAQYYSKVHLDPEQLQIVDGITNILHKFTGMQKFALNGFIWLAIKDWQQKHMKDAAEITGMPGEEREKHVTEMFDFLRPELVKALELEQDKDALEEGINQALQYYIDNFAYR